MEKQEVENKLKEALEKFKASGFKEFNLSSKREEGEDDDSYAVRKYINNILIKLFKGGVIFWDPDRTFRVPLVENGAVVKNESGEIIYTNNIVKAGPYNKKYHG